MWDGAHGAKHEDRAEAMTGPFKWELVNAMKEYGFSISISRTLGTHEIITGHKHWSRLCTTGKSSSQANCGQGVGATWAETAREQGMPDDEWKTVARRLCVSGLKCTATKGTTPWKAQKALKEHEYTTEYETALPDKHAKLRTRSESE